MSTETGTWRLPHRTKDPRVAAARTWPPWDRLALTAALIAPFLLAFALVPFRTDLSHTNAALILVVVVVAVVALGSRTAGVLGALSAAAWFARGGAAIGHSFLTRPYETFDISASADIETAVLLLVVGVIVSQLAARARRLEVITVTDADHLSRIHRTADLARSAGSADTDTSRSVRTRRSRSIRREDSQPSPADTRAGYTTTNSRPARAGHSTARQRTKRPAPQSTRRSRTSSIPAQRTELHNSCAHCRSFVASPGLSPCASTDSCRASSRRPIPVTVEIRRSRSTPFDAALTDTCRFLTP
ncbi:DUF4118 domain-containing protein [Streptomyces sp. NPDC001107]